MWWQLRRGTLHEEAVSPETKGRRGKKVEDSPQGILLQPTAPPAAPVRVRAAVGRDPMVEQALRLVYPRIGSWTMDQQTLAERVLERLILAPGCQEAVEVMTGGLGCPKRAVRNLLDDLEGALDFGGVKLVRLKEEDRAELNRALLDELVSSEADKGGRNGGKA